MEPSVNDTETINESVEFQNHTETSILNFHNYGLQPSESKEAPSNENNADLTKSVIFKFGESYMCPGCQQTFLYLKNLKRHIQNKHPSLFPVLFPLYKTKKSVSHSYRLQPHKKSQHPIDQNNAHKSVSNSDKKSYTCPECQKTSLYLYSFKRHVKTKHPCLFPTLFPSGSSHICNSCEKKFESSKDLQCHKNTIHNLCNGMTQHKCPLCPLMFTRIRFSEHFEKCHNLIMKPIKLNFGSYEEFTEWKKAIERVTKSYFVKHNSKSKQKNGVMRQAFICHRTGTYKSEAVLNKRKLKAQGSRKINAFCPAIMRVTITSEGTCQLIFQNQHIGHDNELQHLNLTREEKKYVADKLASNLNLPISDILGDIHDSAAKDGAERLCLLNKKDLYNIKANFLKDNQFYLSTPKLDEKLTKDLRDIHNKHTESEHICADIVKIEKGWVLSLKDSNEIYLIKEILKSCTCTLVCIYCRVCVNAYSCTCLDSSIEGNMCKHIHFFCMERNKMLDDLHEFLDFNCDVTESSSNSAQCSYPQESEIALKPSESSENSVAFIDSEIRSALKKKFSDIVDSITTEEEYKLSKSAIQDLTMKLRSIQIHTIDNNDAVIPTNSNSVETMLVSESTQDHLYSSPLISKTKKTKQNSNSMKNKIKKAKQNSKSAEPGSRTLILEMRNEKQGAKICYINFAKVDKK